MSGNIAHFDPYPRIPRATFEAVVWSGLAFCTLALAFRCFIRIRVFNRLQADDLLTVFAWLLLLATALTWRFNLDGLYELAIVSSGSKVPAPNFVELSERFLKSSLAVKLMFYIGLWTVKLNFLILFYQLGSSIRSFHIFWWIVTVFTVCSGLAVIGNIHYVCLVSPLEYIQLHCADKAAVRYQIVTLKTNCALDVVSDALIVIFPIAILHNVRINRARKFALGGLFSLVVITIATSIVRVIFAGHNGEAEKVEMTSFWFWCYVELSVALLVACLASFRTLFAHQEKARKIQAADERERVEKAIDGEVKSNVRRARWRHFQDSLFQTAKSEETIQVPENDMRGRPGTMYTV
ncbi:unnamed protein product [Periconia digitata]|uniref:Rhodopsin domain-containing protein n=1 Tax=Periconia digitata TaxID=1303443 RepID=A0A9W4XPB8_9PLEO|nr:unnamed protein product [Periconia digitata]